MPSRFFDGADDTIKLTASSAINALTAPLSIAMIFRHSAGSSVAGDLIALADSGGTSVLQLRILTTDVLRWVGASNSDGPTLSSSGFYFLVARKASGSAAPRFSILFYTTDSTPAHSNGGATSANNAAMGAGGFVWLGAAGGGITQNLACSIFAAAIYDVRLSDASVEAMPWSLAAWLQPPDGTLVQPKAMWMLDQDAAAQNVIDLTGNGSNQSAITGTTPGALPTTPTSISYGARPIVVTRQAPAAASGTAGQRDLACIL